MIIPQKLQTAMTRAGFSQSELARRAGMSSSMIGKLVRGEARGSAHIYEIAKALGVSADFLAGHTDEIGNSDVPSVGTVPALQAYQDIDEDDEIVEVRELDLAFGMGGGSYLDLPVRPKPRKFTRGWLRMFTMSPPTRLFIARGIGDSMAPTIMNADIVIIDTADNRLSMADQIWAIAYGETGMIKRLRPMPTGGVKIMSDNPLVESDTAYDGEMHVVGKVVAVVRKMAG